ncbi:MAG: class I SAM-dependent methyltransferase [Edaphobacter sp.]|uniref:class I SAM-dependent methyltransferase n=1 Tax=Edaphobacter sp. TaxID=1934404 RepID=UPI0023A4A05C|nr:class I SAM-dependent methyltransferase [Edaphobacter sp.]MDE1176205.1 class I SAM-dependent methyltransferase [Edaphobacter sp.]
MAKAPKAKTATKTTAKVQPIRPRDLLIATATPIHPFDQMHGTDTSGLVPASDLVTGHENDEHVTAYYGVAPSILRTLVDHWRRTDPPAHITDYTFLDVGAGKGRAVMLASELPFRQVIGVELNPAMAKIAEANVALWKRTHKADPTAGTIAPTRIVLEDALSFELPTTPTVVFLFHPFEAPVMKLFLRRIEAAFAAHPGTVDLLYVNAEHGSMLEKHPAFHLLWQGSVPMTPEDHAADLEAIAQQAEYGSTGDELCALYRYTGRGKLA